jgi:hypothetical protein
VLNAERTAYFRTAAVYQELRDICTDALAQPHASQQRTSTGAAAATATPIDGLRELLALADLAPALPFEAFDPNTDPAAALAPPPSTTSAVVGPELQSGMFAVMPMTPIAMLIFPVCCAVLCCAVVVCADVTHVLGVTEDALYAASPFAATPQVRVQTLRAAQQTVIPLLERRLREKCEVLRDFYDPITSASASAEAAAVGGEQKESADGLFSPPPFAAAARAGATTAVSAGGWELHMAVDRDQRELARMRTEVGRTRARVDAQFASYYATESDVLMDLCDLIANIRLKHQFKVRKPVDARAPRRACEPAASLISSCVPLCVCVLCAVR